MDGPGLRDPGKMSEPANPAGDDLDTSVDALVIDTGHTPGYHGHCPGDDFNTSVDPFVIDTSSTPGKYRHYPGQGVQGSVYNLVIEPRQGVGQGQRRTDNDGVRIARTIYPMWFTDV